MRSAIPSTSDSNRSVSEETDAPVSRLIVKSVPVDRIWPIRPASATIESLGVPALAKPLIATVSPGWMNLTASSAETTR